MKPFLSCAFYREAGQVALPQVVSVGCRAAIAQAHQREQADQHDGTGHVHRRRPDIEPHREIGRRHQSILLWSYPAPSPGRLLHQVMQRPYALFDARRHRRPHDAAIVAERCAK